MKVHFTADYDHRWPSRAITAFKAGMTLTVRRVVGQAAIDKGKATEVVARGKAVSDAAATANAVLGRRGRMAQPHDADHVGAIVRGAVVDGSKQ